MDQVPRALTIAGSDSGGCAGIQADLKTFAALGVHGMSAVTAVTAQNTTSVRAVVEVPVENVASQIEAVAQDIGVDAVKTGMLPSPSVIRRVAQLIADLRLSPLVVDPVMISTSGFPLIPPEAVDCLVSELFPLATIVTPNLHEAEHLAGRPIRTGQDAIKAALSFSRNRSAAVMIKGGHSTDPDFAVDYFVEEGRVHTLRAKRVSTSNTHGSGCTFAAAITAHLAHGRELLESLERSKAFITEAIRHGLDIGEGPGPVGHFFEFWPKIP